MRRVSFNEADTTGQIVLTGTTATVAGNWDTNNAFTLTPGNAVKGTYSMSGNGRGTLVLTDAASNTYNISIYIVQPHSHRIDGVCGRDGC